MDPELVGDLFRFVGGSSLRARLAQLAGWSLEGLTPAQTEELDRQEAEILRGDRGEPAGRALGPYLLVEKLGGGATSDVWKAWDTKLRRWVAVKEAKLEGPASRERFLREARAASKVRHPHLIEAFDVGREGDVDYLAMTLVEGLPMDRAGHDPRSAARAVADVAGAVQALHEAGLIHRDIKPQNILQDVEGRAILADFGIARDLSAPPLTLEGAVLGTPHYMAPEQAAGTPELIREAADVYGLGATLYHLAGGRPPFAGADLPTLLGKIATAEPAPLRDDIPRPIAAIVRRAMEKDPRDRYPTAAAFEEDLRRFLRGEPLRSGSAAWRWLRRRWSWIAGGAAALALLVALWIPSRRAAEAVAIHNEGVERWARGDVAGAEAWFARAGERPESMLMRGRCLLRMGKSKEALDLWNRLLEAHPNYGPVLLERGKLRMAATIHRQVPVAGRRSGRGVVFQASKPAPDPDLLRAEPALRELDRTEQAFSVGEFLLRRGRAPEAVEHLKTYAERQPWDPAAHSFLAAAAFLAGDYATADAALTAALALEPRSDRYLARGDARLAGGRYEGAVEDYARAGDEGRRGLALQSLGKLEEAEAAFDRAPRSARTLVNRGTVRAERKNLEGAKRDFEAALELDERSADAYHNLAGVNLLEQDVEAALRHFDLALGCDAEFMEAYIGRARARIRLGQPEKAVPDFERALRRSADLDLHLEAAAAYFLAGEKAKAVDAVRRALLDGGDAWPSRPAAEKLLKEWSP